MLKYFWKTSKKNSVPDVGGSYEKLKKLKAFKVLTSKTTSEPKNRYHLRQNDKKQKLIQQGKNKKAKVYKEPVLFSPNNEDFDFGSGNQQIAALLNHFCELNKGAVEHKRQQNISLSNNDKIYKIDFKK